MSRNQREGRYFGWAKGHHVRDRNKIKVNSWRAFRTLAGRRAVAWAKRVMAARTVRAAAQGQGGGGAN